MISAAPEAGEPCAATLTQAKATARAMASLPSCAPSPVTLWSALLLQGCCYFTKLPDNYQTT